LNKTNKYKKLGLTGNPFKDMIGQHSEKQNYKLVGRKDAIKSLHNFVIEALTAKQMKRVMIIGDYGTGKSHHLASLEREINENGKLIPEEYKGKVAAVYLDSLGLSFKKLYLNITERLSEIDENFKEIIDSMDPVEPEKSVEKGFNITALRENILKNFKLIMAKAKNIGYKAIFIFTDEAEDIVQCKDTGVISEFITSLTHFVNKLTGTGLHLIMGFTAVAISVLSSPIGSSDGSSRGGALLQRLSETENIYLGFLNATEVKEMVIDRLKSVKTDKISKIAPFLEGTMKDLEFILEGHPREIISVLDKTLDRAAASGNEIVDGEMVLQTLIDHQSYKTGKPLINMEEFTRLKSYLEEISEDVSKEFDKLWGELICENAHKTENDFINKKFLPQLLKSSGNTPKILDKIPRKGKTYYRISEDALVKILHGKRYGAKTELKIDELKIKMTQNPNDYSKDLTIGMFFFLKNIFKAKGSSDFEGKTMLVDIKLDENQFWPFTINCDINRTVPIEIIKEMIDNIEDGKAKFGLIIRKGSAINPEINDLKRQLNDRGKLHIFNRIWEIKLTNKDLDIDPKFFERFVLQKRINFEEERDIKKPEFDWKNAAQLVKIEDDLQKFVNKNAIPYPKLLDKKIIELLIGSPGKGFNISELKEQTEENAIDQISMNNLANLGLIKKSGRQYLAPDPDSSTIWKRVLNIILDYDSIDSDKIITIENFTDKLNELFVLECQLGEEKEVATWYLQNLKALGVIELDKYEDTKTTTMQIKYIDNRTRLASICDTKEDIIKNFKKMIEVARNLPILKQRIKSEESNIDVVEGRIRNCRKLTSPTGKSVEEIKIGLRALNSKLNNFEELIDETINATRNNAESIIERIEVVQNEIIDQANLLDPIEEKSYSSELQTYIDDIKKYIKEENYLHLSKLEEEIDPKIISLSSLIDERKNSIEPSKELAIKTTEYKKELADLKTKMLDLSLTKFLQDNQQKIKEIEKQEESAKSYFNINQYDKSLQAYESLIGELRSIINDFKYLVEEIEDAKTKIKQIEKLPENKRLQNLKKKIEDEISQGDRAAYSGSIKLITKELEKQGIKSVDKYILDKFKNKEELDIKELTDIFDVDEIFPILKQLYNKGELKKIILRRK